MKDVRLIQVAKRKQESRNIAKEILNFGVTEEQKIDIMFNIAMSLEQNTAMKEITLVLKNYQKTINNESEDDIVENKNKKIILT
jgi:hypothetical protein